jgi:[ribosomal protein S18]-alanine N-acetyltransferase
MTVEEFAALHARCFDTAPRPWSAAEFLGLFRMPGVLLLEHGQGFAVVRLAGPEAEVLTLVVAPECQRQGIARALLRQIEARVLASGGEQILLEVAATNSAARSLYASEGYEQVGRRCGYYGTPRGPKIDALVLAKCVAGRA